MRPGDRAQHPSCPHVRRVTDHNRGRCGVDQITAIITAEAKLHMRCSVSHEGRVHVHIACKHLARVALVSVIPGGLGAGRPAFFVGFTILTPIVESGSGKDHTFSVDYGQEVFLAPRQDMLHSGAVQAAIPGTDLVMLLGTLLAQTF